MRRAQSGQQQSAGAEANRAADRLKEAQDALRGMRQQESGQELSDLARRAEQLAAQQQEFLKKLTKTFGAAGSEQRIGQSREQAESLAREKEGMLNDLKKLERDMQTGVRNLAGSQRGASSKLREGLGDMQQNELKLRMQFGADALRRGMGAFIAPREAPVTQGLERLKEQVKQAQAAAGQGSQSGKDPGIERALNQVEQMRQQLERMAGGKQPGQREQGQQPGQEGQQGQG
ncbi:MAG: hypothetical protein WKF37_18500, partial [Bryobacteraceae bacterium]